MNLKFRHKILLCACGVVVLAFALFTLYNDYLQRNTIRQNIESSVKQAGALTASSVQNWMSGRILVLENLAQDVAHQRRFPGTGRLALVHQQFPVHLCRPGQRCVHPAPGREDA
jgi:hypothetical protein